MQITGRQLAFRVLFLGIGCFVILWMALEVHLFVQRSFETSAGYGWISLSLVIGMVGALTWILASEVIAYVKLRSVERLQKAIQSDNNPTFTKHLLETYCQRLRRRHDPEINSAIGHFERSEQEMRTAEGKVAPLNVRIERTLLVPLDRRVDRIIQRESVSVGLITGLAPWAVIDAILVLWRNVRMMRNIASVYGVRPGIAGTTRLVRKALFNVVVADLSQHASDLVTSKVPALGVVAPAAAQGMTSAMLTIRLGLWTQAMCRPTAPAGRRAISSFFATNAKNFFLDRVSKPLASLIKKKGRRSSDGVQVAG